VPPIISREFYLSDQVLFLRGNSGVKALVTELRPGSSPAASSRPAQLNGPLEAPASVGHQAPLCRHGHGRLPKLRSSLL